MSVRNQCRNCEHLRLRGDSHTVKCNAGRTINQQELDCPLFEQGKYRLCTKCWEFKHQFEFYRDRHSRDGIDVYCSSCRKELRIASNWAERGNAKRAERAKADPAFRERLCEYSRNYRKTH